VQALAATDDGTSAYVFPARIVASILNLVRSAAMYTSIYLLDLYCMPPSAGASMYLSTYFKIYYTCSAGTKFSIHVPVVVPGYIRTSTFSGTAACVHSCTYYSTVDQVLARALSSSKISILT
jgi:hypothetical protein